MFVISQKLKKLFVGFLLVTSVIFVISFKQLPDEKFHLYFLNVGQGDSIFVKTPQNHQIIIDAGPGKRVGEEITKIMPFWDREIDLLVLTHPDKDHMEGFLDLLKRYRFNTVLITGVNKKDYNYEQFLNEIEKQDSRIIFANSKTDLQAGRVVFDLLYPQDQMVTANIDKINNSSIVMKIKYQNRRILLSGDLDEIAEKYLVKKGVNLEADIFKAGHHGSKTSSSKEFLEKIKPEIVVVQVGKNNYGHPTDEALKRFAELGAKILRTDVDGRVEFVF